MSPRPPKPPRPWGWHSLRSRRGPSLERREKHEKHDHLKPRQDDPQTSTTAVRPQELASFISLAFAPAAQPFGVDPLYLNSLRHTNRSARACLLTPALRATMEARQTRQGRAQLSGITSVTCRPLHPSSHGIWSAPHTRLKHSREISHFRSRAPSIAWLSTPMVPLS